MPIPDDTHEGGAVGVPASEVKQPTPTPEVEESEDAAEEQQPDTESEGEAVTEQREPPPSEDARRRARDRAKIERLETQIKELQRHTPGVSMQNLDAAVEQIVGPPPRDQDYRGDFLAYDRDLTAYLLDKRIATREVRTRAQNHEALRAEQMREAAETHQDRVEDFKERTPDFDQVMQQATAAGLKASPVLEDLILESDHSAHLIYYFAKNPNVLDQLNQMTERQAAKAIGSIESRLSVPSQRTRQQTRAPAPYRPLVGGAAAPDDFSGYLKWEREKYGKR